LIIGANKNDIYQRFSIGGGYDIESLGEMAEFSKAQGQLNRAKRFKPMSIFKGPFTTDENGYAEVDFSIGDYRGAVEVIAVAVKGNSYGNAHKTVKVKSDVVLLPTLPRKLAPKDKFIIPVDVFTTEDGIGEISIKISSDEKIKFIETQKTVTLYKKGQKSISFDAEVEDVMGISEIKIVAKYGDKSSKTITEIAINPNSFRIYDETKLSLTRGEKTEIRLPKKYITNSQEYSLAIKKIDTVDFKKVIDRLVSYPYNYLYCTVSAGFNQIYLKEMINNDSLDVGTIDKHIALAIRKMPQYQSSRGGFGCYPSSRNTYKHTTAYALHFLWEARRMGYEVPEYLITRAKRFLTRKCKDYQYKKSNIYGQLYSLYVLALINEPDLSSTNYIRENYLSTLDDHQRWLLAGIYKVAKYDELAGTIRSQAGLITTDYTKSIGSYWTKKEALTLLAMLHFDNVSHAKDIYEELVSMVNQEEYIPTYSLIAIKNYLDKNSVKHVNEAKIKVKVTKSDGKEEIIETADMITNLALDGKPNEKIKVMVDKDTETKKVYLTLNHNGVLREAQTETLHENIVATYELFNAKGDRLDTATSIADLKQGDRIKAKIKVKNNYEQKEIDQLVVMFMLPSGLELSD
ncbi:MAG: alpha-2-macroglobulin family protein, partial [Candidatus Cloacimonadota bacterium]|nr:alpha-2-macroglobulin family protein [Candidatus Cloacimonadota bacterium]